MRISQLGKRLVEYYEAGTISGKGKASVLLLGPPGILSLTKLGLFQPIR